VTLNAKEAQIRGLEAEGDFIFNDYIRLNLFANVTDARYESFDLPNIVVDPTSPDGIRIASYTDVSGNPFPNVPKFQAGWTLNVKAPVPEGIGDIEGALTYYHQNSFVFSNDFAHESEGYAPGYGLWNINIDWNKPLGQPVDLSFFVANLADKVYDRGGISVEQQLGITEVFYGEPRTFGFRLKYSFGGAQ
jgi:iron complex outermembrane receptor protein